MTGARPVTFEALRALVAGVPASDLSGRRNVVWCDEGRRLAVARDLSGRLEIFVTGDAVAFESESLRRAMDHRRWRWHDGEEVMATRIHLPPASEFDAVGSLICVELLSNGVTRDGPAALRKSEPLIEFIVGRLASRDEVAVGLVGELLLMDALTSEIDAEVVAAAWNGHRRSARDFQLGGVGIEVKSTRGIESTHRFHGLRQTELGHGVDGVYEHELFVVSLGLEEVTEDVIGAFSARQLAESVQEKLRGQRAEEALADLSDKLSSYGLNARLDPSQAWSAPIDIGRWRLTFARAYDMNDDAIDLPKTSDVDRFTMLDVGSLEFVGRLPMKVAGDLNPVSGLQALVREITARYER